MSYFEHTMFDILFYTNECYKKCLRTVDYYIGGVFYKKSLKAVANPEDPCLTYNIQKIVYHFNGLTRDIDIYELCFLKWNEDSFVEILYEYDNDDYIICSDKEQLENMQFFINNSKGLINDDRDIMAGVLYSENIETGNDITHIMKKYAGPNQDFYKSINIKFKKEWLPFNDDILIINKMAKKTIYKNKDTM